MLTFKRVFIATLFGIACGLICLFLASSDPAQPINCGLKLTIIISRTLLGFTIGISALRLAWWLHGIVLGYLVSIPMALAIIYDWKIAVATLVMGIIYGLIIELFTSVIFKAKPMGLLPKT